MEFVCRGCGLIWYSECRECGSLNIGYNKLIGATCLNCGSYKLNNKCPSCETAAAKPQEVSGCYLSAASVRARGLKEDDCKELVVLQSYRDEILNGSEELLALSRDVYESTPKIINAVCKKSGALNILDKLYYELVEKTAKMLSLGKIREAVKNYIICYNSAKKRFIKEKPQKNIEELKTVYLSNCKIIGGELIFYTKLKEISKKTFKDFSVLINKARIPEGTELIKESAFRDCVNLSDIVLPESLKRIEYRAFSNCRTLEKISIPKNVTYLGCCLFAGCDSLESVDFGTYSNDFVASHAGGNALCDYSGSCRALSEIKIDENNSAYTVLDGVLFSKDLKKLIIYPPGLNAESYTVPDTVEVIEDSAFYRCSNLRSVTLGKSVGIICEHAFEYCSELTEIIINDGIKKIGMQAFMDCRSLAKVNIPDSCTDIQPFAFSRCGSLEAISIPDSINIISPGVFRECISLKNVYISDSIKSIKELAFSECRSLNALELPVSVNSAEWDIFLNCSESLKINIRNSIETFNAEGYILKIKHVE